MIRSRIIHMSGVCLSAVISLGVPHSSTNTELPAVQMELRYTEVDRARNIYERYVQCLPTVKAWVRYAKFEMKNGQIGLARKCYERAVGEMGEDGQNVSQA